MARRSWWLDTLANPFNALLVRTVIIPIFATTAAVCVLGWQFSRSAADAKWIDRTDLVIATAEDSQTHFANAESSLRGYLLTGRESYVGSYKAELSSASAHLYRLKKLVRDNPGQVRRVEDIGALTDGWRQLAQVEIDLRRSGGDYVQVVKQGVASDELNTVRSDFSDFLATERGFRVERAAKSQESNRNLIIWAIVIGPAAGIFLGMVGIREISRLSETYRLALEVAHSSQQEAVEANQAKDEFMAMISHELRNPINSITLSARRLRYDRSFPGNLLRPLDAIDRASAMIDGMAGDLIDSTRIASGQLRLKREPVDLAEIVRGAIEMMRSSAESKNIKLVSMMALESAPMEGDRERLRESACNLLANAIKFTSKGGTIETTLRSEGEGVELSVTDTGAGIDAAFLPRVFDRFAQDNSSTERRGGLGLGLAIVKYVIELHGGTVTAHSEGTGRGAKFVIFLPLMQKQSNHPAEKV